MATMMSCNKDNEELIVGKWRIHSIEGMYTGQTISDGDVTYSPNQIEYVDNWGWVFKADGTGYSYEIRDGREIEMSQFTYTIDDETLHLPFVDYSIDNLNRRKLRLCDTVKITDAYGTFIRYEYGYLNFKKQ